VPRPKDATESGLAHPHSRGAIIGVLATGTELLPRAASSALNASLQHPTAYVACDGVVDANAYTV